MTPKKLQYFAGGEWKESQTTKWMDCYDPSTGQVIAQAPQCTVAEVEEAVAAAAAAYPAWADTPASKRVQVLFRMKALLDEHLDELTYLVAQEHGKVWDEAMGDVLKVTEVVEFACGIPHLMKGPALMDCTRGYDTTQYMEPMGVFAGIVAVELPRHDPDGLDGAAVHRHRQHPRVETRQLHAAYLHAHRRAVAGSRAAEGRAQPGHLLAPRGRDPAQAPRHQGHFVRRLHRRRPAYLLDRGRGRQAGAGADRGQEPRAGAAGRRPGTLGARHHQLGVRLRGRTLHGAAGGRRRGSHRR